MTSKDLIGAGDDWIPEADYEFIVARVPILCVDLIPLSNDEPPKVGLIERQTPDGYRCCLVGGRVIRDEPLITAVQRHLHVTLGNAVNVDLATLQPLDVFQYFTRPDLGEFHDSRKHAVSLTYFGRCHGPIEVQKDDSEAMHFDWHPQDRLPSLQYGFDQGGVIKRFLHRDTEIMRMGLC